MIVNVHDIVFLPTDRINRCYDLVETYPEQNSSYYCADVVYDVQVCGESYYTLFEGAKALDNTPYCIDDNVIVTPFPSSDEADVDAESLCYASCGSACFAAASSLIISVAILPVDGAVIPRWSEVKESR